MVFIAIFMHHQGTKEKRLPARLFRYLRGTQISTIYYIYYTALETKYEIEDSSRLLWLRSFKMHEERLQHTKLDSSHT